MSLLLAGLRVIDCSQVIQAAAAAAVLRELGADVIKVESPAGDISRTWTRVFGVSHELPGGRNATFEWVNRGKRSITLDLKSVAGQEILYRLAREADVFLTNHRDDIRQRLRFDFESLRAINPALVYGVGNAYGSAGPAAGDGGYDNVAFARSGLMYCIGGGTGEPEYMTAGLVDQAAGTMLATGVLAALVARGRTGHGQQVETSLLGAVLHLMSSPLNSYLLTGQLPTTPRRRELASPLVGWYRCRDGLWLMLSINRPQQSWADFCRILGLDIVDDERFSTVKARAVHHQELIAMIDAAMATAERETWLTRLHAADMLCGPVNRLEDLPHDAQVQANSYIRSFEHEDLGPTSLVALPLEFGEGEVAADAIAPALGQHTEEILLELGYDWDEIESFRSSGVL